MNVTVHMMKADRDKWRKRTFITLALAMLLAVAVMHNLLEDLNTHTNTESTHND